jgi:3-dehydroquinate synthase
MSTSSSLLFGSIIEGNLDEFLKGYESVRKIIFTDETVFDLWIEDLLTHHPSLHHAEIIQVPPGEANKTLEICQQVWQALSEYEITRHDLFINFGGGVITDMGGFIASTYKRGIDFINIPTTLLSQVDASVGGKTGIDLGGFKNQIGLFAEPQAVFIDPKYHQTLPEEQILSGFAEMLKHGLIADKNHWLDLMNEKRNLSTSINIELIEKSVAIKKEIVLRDPHESNIRKLLNYGHTIGHAIEGAFLMSGQPVPHGFAVAWGMVLENELACQESLLPEKEKNEVNKAIMSLFPSFSLNNAQKKWVYDLIGNDKKKNDSQLNFSLIKKIGEGIIDQKIELETVIKIIEKYT